MKVWSAIFNLFAVLIMAFLLILFHRADKLHTRQFEELRLRYATDYAVEAAFRSTLDIEDIGIDYTDIDNVIINPSILLKVYKSVLCLSYDMSASQENFRHIENFIPTGVLFSNDGYYILDMVEYDGSTSYGNEYQLQWSPKKPYSLDGYLEDVSIQDGNGATRRIYGVYAPNIYNDTWTFVYNEGSTVFITDGRKHLEPGRITDLTRTKIQNTVSSKVSQDINYVIYKRNLENTNNLKMPSFYLPSGPSMTSINEIKRPTLLMFMQGVDFAKGMKIDSVSVGGTRTERKRVVVGFEENGVKYYCYETQIDLPKLEQMKANGQIEIFLSTIEEAALKGYSPHFEYLGKPIREID